MFSCLHGSVSFQSSFYLHLFSLDNMEEDDDLFRFCLLVLFGPQDSGGLPLSPPPFFDGLHNDSTGASYGSGVDTETTIHTEITSTQANTPLHMHNFPLSHPTHYSTD